MCGTRTGCGEREATTCGQPACLCRSTGHGLGPAERRRQPGSLIHRDPLIHVPMATLLLVAPAAALGAAEDAVGVPREQMLVRKVKNTADNRQGGYTAGPGALLESHLTCGHRAPALAGGGQNGG